MFGQHNRYDPGERSWVTSLQLTWDILGATEVGQSPGSTGDGPSSGQLDSSAMGGQGLLFHEPGDHLRGPPLSL